MQNWAKEYNFPCYQRDLTTLNRHEEPGFQEFARDWRMKESQKILENINSNNGHYKDKAIATAHHDDDQLETIILKLLRGSHISNLYPVGFHNIWLYI